MPTAAGPAPDHQQGNGGPAGGAGGTEGVDLPPDGVPRVPPCPIACQGAIPYRTDKHPRLRMDLAERREPSPVTERHHWSRTVG
mgnify:CR=1 FL=1